MTCSICDDPNCKDKWSARHYKIVEESERMIKENKQGKVIDI